jgi:two-component system chemotaxis sensor kinase CheA
MLELRGRRLPLVHLAEVLGLAGGEDAYIVLLRAAGGTIYGVAVSRVGDQDELVVKPAAPQVMETGLYGGTTLTEDGMPVLMIDPMGLAARCGIKGKGEPETPPADEQANGEPCRPALLFTRLCGAVCAVPLSAVVRIEAIDASAVASSAGRLHVALGERLLPLFGCESAPPGRRFNVVRLSDGEREIAYAAAAVLDTVAIPAETTPAPFGDVAAVALIDGKHVEILDLHRLFSDSGAPAASGRPLCLLPEGDPWVDAFLRPLVESAGYATSAAAAGGAEPQCVIVTEDQAAAPVSPAARVVRLRSLPAPAAESDDSIYRYDRDALLRALGQGS